MIARGAESNPSCFNLAGLLDPATVVLPLYLRVVRSFLLPSYLAHSLFPPGHCNRQSLREQQVHDELDQPHRLALRPSERPSH